MSQRESTTQQQQQDDTFTETEVKVMLAMAKCPATAAFIGTLLPKNEHVADYINDMIRRGMLKHVRKGGRVVYDVGRKYTDMYKVQSMSSDPRGTVNGKNHSKHGKSFGSTRRTYHTSARKENWKDRRARTVQTAQGFANDKVKILEFLRLTPAYWDRHKLTASDLLHICSFSSSQLVLLLSMLSGIQLSASVVKTSFGNVCDILITSKSSSFRKAIHTLKYNCDKHMTNRLEISSMSSIDHLPALPRHYVDGTHTFCKLATMLHPNLKVLEDNHVQVGGFYNFLGLTWIMLSFEGTSIAAARV